MNPLSVATLRPLFVFPILAVAAGFLAISALVIIRNAPLVIRGSLLAWLLTVSSASLVLATIVLFAATSEPAVCVYLIVPALIIFGAWRSTQGYLVIGVTEADLRASLQAVLSELGLPFEESILGFALTSLHNNLQVRIHPQLGTAQLRMELQGHSPELTQIARRGSHHLRHYGEANITAALIYGALGLFCLALALYQAQRF